MGQLVYSIPTIYLVGMLLLLMVIAMAVAHFFGRQRSHDASEELHTQTTAVQGSLLGLLALLLGFTFSIALSRHESRSIAVVDEANAVGTAWLRISLLPEAEQAAARDGMLKYVQLRIDGAEFSMNHDTERLVVATQAQDTFDDLWAHGAKVVRETGGPAVVSYTSSLNDMIDSFGVRNASIERRIPATIMNLMWITFVLAGAMMGYATGLAGTRPATPIYLMMTLIVLLVFMIVDLDRPRRGLIEVDQTPMFDLRETMRRA